MEDKGKKSDGNSENYGTVESETKRISEKLRKAAEGKQIPFGRQKESDDASRE